MINLKEVFEVLPEKWVCDPAHYPALAVLKNTPFANDFKRKHALLHLIKQLGKIETMEEKIDHGAREAFDEELVVECLAKSIINCMQYARVSEINPEKIEKWISNFITK